MAEFFGDLERLAADLFPYRWLIAAVLLVAIAAVAFFGYRRGWHLWLWNYRVRVAIIGTPVLALVGFVAWDLGSPLFINKTVEEEFPFAFSAVLPQDIEREDVEKVMTLIAKVAPEPVDEPMPEKMMTPVVTSAVQTTVSPEPTDTPTAAPPTVTAVPAPTATQEPGATAVAAPAATQELADTPTPVPAPTPVPTAEPPPLATPEPSEVTAETAPVTLKVGTFEDQDAFHKGSGEATIYRGPDGSHLLRLENLDVTNGPDLHVILTPLRNPENRADVMTPGWIDLGSLKGNRGNQNYPIPEGVDIAAQGSVVIYCKPFHVIFSVAPLEDAG